MRKVSISKLTPEMRLAKAVSHGNYVLIKEGTDHLGRFVNSLKKVGIYHLYVEDEVSAEILDEDSVSDKTRKKCRKIVRVMMDKLEAGFTVDQTRVMSVVNNLMDEILKHPDTLASLSQIGDKDDSTLDHSVNTTVYAVCLGLDLRMGIDDLRDLAEACLLHDVGKILLDSRIVFKKKALTDQEFNHIKTHSLLGYELLEKIPSLPERVRQVALCHHERLDGSGYPWGLAGDEISLFSRIAAIADMFDALTSDRCYRSAISASSALDILMCDAAEKLDFRLTSRFVRIVAAYPNGTLVQMSDGTQGIVARQNHSMPLRPVVRVIENRDGHETVVRETDLMKELNLTIIDTENREYLKCCSL